MRGKTSKISLEDYLHFFLSHKKFGLTANFLNQIIRMHGFKKIYKVSQKVLIDAVDEIDLENLSRSTVKEKNEISSCALMNKEDIVADMKELDWQECCVTSIQSLNAKSDLQAVAGGGGGGGTRKRKRGSSSAGGGGGGGTRKRKRGSSSAGGGGGGTRKRKRGSSSAGGGGGGGAADAVSTTTALV